MFSMLIISHLIYAIPSPKQVKESRAFRVKLKSSKTTACPGKAHDRDCSTFTNDCASGCAHGFETDEPCDLWSVGQHWTDHDVRALALDRTRRELPDDPAMVSQPIGLAASDVDFVHEPVMASQSRIYCRWR